MYWFSAISGAANFVFPSVAVAVAVACVSAVAFRLLSGPTPPVVEGSPPAEPLPKLRDIVNFAVVFALFGYTLGIFIGLMGDKLITTVIGTVSTTAAAYLALLYGKDTLVISRQAVAAGLVAFFINIPLATQYARHYA